MENNEAADSDRVSLMTLHGAKGLEFDTVFLPGWEEGLFPNQRALDEGREKSLEEERRLAYVGLTRARRRAFSHAANRQIYANWQSSTPSRFIAELPNATWSRPARRHLLAMRGYWRQQHILGQFPLVARRTRTIEAWEQPPRPARADALPIGSRVFHQKFGYGTVRRPRTTGWTWRSTKRARNVCWIASWRRYEASSSQRQCCVTPTSTSQDGGDRSRGYLRSLRPCVRGSAGGTFFAATSHPSKPCLLTYRKLGLEIYEAALSSVCATVGLFCDHRTGAWRVEGVTPVGDNQSALVAALALAAELSGVEAPVRRMPTEAEGWLARSYASFPEQLIGRRFSVRGTHLCIPPPAGRFTLTLDAGLAFGSGEHGSTRGCIRALERVAWRHPRRVLDLGTGSGILAMAAARLLHRAVLATDIEPWSICVAKQNAALNRLGRPGQGTACERLATSGSSGQRALRSRARQHPGPAAVPHGAPTRAKSGTWGDGHPRGTVAEPGAQRPGGPSALWT